MSRIQTLCDVYFHALEHHAKPDAFRTKADSRYRDISSEDFGRVGAEISLGLLSLGLEKGARVAILSETRLEWAQMDMGILTAGLVSVPIYPTLPTDAVDYIVGDSGAEVLVASTAEQAAKAKEIQRARSGLQVVVLDEPPGEGMLTLEEVRERGRRQGAKDPDLRRRRSASVEAGDLATIIYTSGTTGIPKGVMLTHANIASNVVSGLEVLGLREDDTCLSFLPLSHIFERMAGLYCMVYAGVTIAYAESFSTVPDNLKEVRPTVVMSVPRLYEKMYARIFEAASAGNAIEKNLFYWARRVGIERSRLLLAGEPVGTALELQYKLASRLVFSKIRNRTGGRLRFFVSGGAPLSREIAEFFHAAGIPILEGYGLTETSPVLTVNTFDDYRLGTVGKPIPGVEIKIAEDGEILARGPNIMQGYYNLPEATEDALRNGWFHTGDIGHLDKDGFLVITDRKKDLIVTAGGKNVAPQPLENALKADKFFSEVVVLGDKRPYLVALVVPDFEVLGKYAEAHDLGSTEPAALAANPRIQELLQSRIDRRQEGQAAYATVKKIHVLDRDLEIAEDELTPTLKVKRDEVTKRFEKEIEALYHG